MRKFVRILMFTIFGLFLLGAAIIYFTNKNKPIETPTLEADQLAIKMLDALNQNAWDTLKFLQWNFKGARKFVWDKQRNYAVISWDEYRVIMDLSEVKGIAYKNEIKLEEDSSKEILDKAWSYWCNDSFWMFAPFKVNDPGTVRSMGEDNDAPYSLSVKYETGGVTPGDTYLWLLDENYIPTGFKMWVKVIPVGGTYFSWENWTDLPCGAKVALTHKNVATTLELTEVKEGKTWKDFDFEVDPFAEIENMKGL